MQILGPAPPPPPPTHLPPFFLNVQSPQWSTSNASVLNEEKGKRGGVGGVYPQAQSSVLMAQYLYTICVSISPVLT